MAENNQSRMARRNQKKKPTKKSNKSVMKKIMYGALIAIGVIGISVGILFTYYIATAPELDPEKLEDPFSSKFYDMDGNHIGYLGDIRRTKITYDELPDVLIDAVIATEDARFFKHSGIDLRRIASAIKGNITDGFGSQGASTITQQVIENSFYDKEKKIKRKVQEQWLALKLERKYSKEEILEMYLNKINYGSGAYGVASASEEYFGKTDLHELTLVEAAILAGLPQRPTAYNPYESPDLTAGRVDTVLKLMVRHGKITQEEADEAREVDIESLLAGKRSKASPYEAFRQQLRDEINEKLEGVDAYTAGLKIYTTLDTDAQEHVEHLLTDSDENPIPYPDDELEVGLTVLDTKSGAIRAIGGSRNRENIDGLNYGTKAKHQPGSTFKPIIAYGPAIEYKKWSTYQQLNDDKPYDEGIETPIRNWNRKYQGWMSARYALANSLNVPTVKTLVETGYGDAQKFAEGIGIKFHDDKIDIRDAIGGTSTEVTPLQLAGSFRAFGNEGIYNEPYAVEKVEFPDGTVVDLRPEAEPAMSDYTAYMVTDMLKSVMSEGTGQSANISGLPVAGKTGTTNLQGQDGSPDAWFAGYTTNYTISIWAGGYENDNGERAVIPTNVPQGTQPGTQIPRTLFKNIMTELSKDVETKDFERPSSVVEVEIEKGSNPAALPSAHTPQENIVKELFVKGTEPSSVSEKFDQLDPVSNLQATYDEDNEEIEVTWSYDDDDHDVEFEVSMKEDDKGMEKLSTTDDTDYTISNVKDGGTYTIQIVVIDKDNDSLKSEPATTTVTLKEEEEDVPSVTDLDVQYNESNKVLDVQWNYDGPDATFEVSVSPTGNQQTVQGTQLEITNVQPGTTYTITVTPISKEQDVEGPPSQVTISIDPEEDEGNDDGDEGNDDNDGDDNNDDDNNGDEGNDEEDNGEDEGNNDEDDNNES